MSLGIAFKGTEGIVLAADSRITLTATLNPNDQVKVLLPAYYDNATKLLRVEGQQFVGAITFGAGTIGQSKPRTASSFMPEFEATLNGESRLGVEDFATCLSDFFLAQWNDAGMPMEGVDPMTFFVGGYDEGQPYGRIFEFIIPNKPKPSEWQAGDDQFGSVWGGQTEVVNRLMNGFDPEIISIIENEPILSKEQRVVLTGRLQSKLPIRIPFQFLPLQDCVDLSIFLIRATLTLQTWQIDVRGVGGEIDVATITRTKGFEYIQNKKIKGAVK